METYDAWVAGELPFDSPEIRRVFDIMDDIWLDEAMVFGGTEAILSENFFESASRLFEEPPGCYLSLQPSFFLGAIRELGVDEKAFDLFYLPPIDAAYGRPVLGGGDTVAMFADRPEVREVMRYLTTSDSAEFLIKEGGMISPYRDTPFDWYASPAQLKMAQILLEADTYRFDGSDLMPPEVGNGTFLRGMVDWVEGEDLTTVLQTIDESWPKEE